MQGTAWQAPEAAPAGLCCGLGGSGAALCRAFADRHQYWLRTRSRASDIQNSQRFFRLERHVLAERAADDDAIDTGIGLEPEAAFHFGKI
ncbi:hypothetical protein GGD56_005900 [Rhizobium mongolense]|uniref:Uncharacterized protein n=1 Tax=Rhizobium mongolense TaxID=57676 RepID=A0ABR6IVR6_9HYPH|nr:hypothetical protein [Rhizobium mongolense]